MSQSEALALKRVSGRLVWCGPKYVVVYRRYLRDRGSWKWIAEVRTCGERGLLLAFVNRVRVAVAHFPFSPVLIFTTATSKTIPTTCDGRTLSSPTVSRRVFGDRLNTRLFIRSPSTGNSGILTFSPGHLRQSALWQPGLSPITLTSYDPKTAFLRFYCPQ
jgi:hypothetical protein